MSYQTHCTQLDASTAADTFSYALDPRVDLDDARLDWTGTNVWLTTRDPLIEGAPYTVMVDGVTDNLGNGVLWTEFRFQATALRAARQPDGSLLVGWPAAGVLESAASPQGAWQNLTATTNPMPIVPCEGSQFYRVRFP